MAESISCAIHGERQETYVCSHLTTADVALGFNGDSPSPSRPFPDAWCDNCELIRASHGGWNEQSQKLLNVKVVCSECYRRIRIRNTRTAMTLDDLVALRWKCSSCDEWHKGPCLDFSYGCPAYWTREHGEIAGRTPPHEEWTRDLHSGTFLNKDYCVIEGRDFFVHGIIKLPIIGTAEDFCWGVWGSLSQQNFELLLAKEDDPTRADLPPMFSWLSNKIEEYPDTLNLKMYAHVQKPSEVPIFELEASEHPLSLEYHNGISPEKVKSIMLERLRDVC